MNINDLLPICVDLKNTLNNIVTEYGKGYSFESFKLDSGVRVFVHDELYRNNLDYKKTYDDLHSINDKIYNYCKDIITTEFTNFGVDKMRVKFYEMKSQIIKDDLHDDAVGIVIFELAAYTSGLVKNLNK